MDGRSRPEESSSRPNWNAGAYVRHSFLPFSLKLPRATVFFLTCLFPLKQFRLDFHLIVLEFVYRLALTYLPQHKRAQGLHAEIKCEKEYDGHQDAQHECDRLHVFVSVHAPHRINDEAGTRYDGAAEYHPFVARIHESREGRREHRTNDDERKLLPQYIAV